MHTLMLDLLPQTKRRVTLAAHVSLANTWGLVLAAAASQEGHADTILCLQGRGPFPTYRRGWGTVTALCHTRTSSMEGASQLWPAQAQAPCPCVCFVMIGGPSPPLHRFLNVLVPWHPVDNNLTFLQRKGCRYSKLNGDISIYYMT